MDKNAQHKKRVARDILRLEKDLKEVEKKLKWLEILSKYPIRSKNSPFKVGDAVHYYGRILIIRKIQPKKDIYYVRDYEHKALIDVHGKDFHKSFSHATPEQIKEYIYEERTEIYIRRCNLAFYFMVDCSRRNNNSGLMRWSQEGIEICRAYAHDVAFPIPF